MWAGHSVRQGWQRTMKIRMAGNETRNVISSRRCTGFDKRRDVSAAEPCGNDVHEVCDKLATWSDKCCKVTTELDLCQSILKGSDPSSAWKHFCCLRWKLLFRKESDSIYDSVSFPFLSFSRLKTPPPPHINQRCSFSIVIVVLLRNISSTNISHATDG